ncbi:MAG TPA: MaoC/PaaZ C-terminal domain-containing protein [Polyangia bacterium]|jgi:acyl dehydratase
MDPVRDADVALRRRVTQDDFDRFALLTGDDNPIHVDAAFAARTRFGRTLAHGMMLYALVGELVCGTLLPGAVEKEVRLVFPGPIFAGDEIVIAARIVAVADGGIDVEAEARRVADGGVGCELRAFVTHG